MVNLLDKLVDKIINWIPPFCERYLGFRVITKFVYPSTDKVDTSIFYLFPDENVEVLDSKKIIAVITRKGFFRPYIIVEFPNIIPNK